MIGKDMFENVSAAQVLTSGELTDGAEPVGSYKPFAYYIYFFGRTVSFIPLPTRNFRVVFAGIWMVSPVAGFLPSRALRSDLTSLPNPGRTNSPLDFTSREAKL